VWLFMVLFEAPYFITLNIELNKELGGVTVLRRTLKTICQST